MPPPAPLPPPPPAYGQETKRIFVSRAVRDEAISLRELAGIGAEYRHWEVTAIRANTRPNSSARTTVTLVSNGRIVGTQVNPGRRINLVPERRITLGEDISNLGIAVAGSTIIEDLEIELRYQEERVIEIYLNSNVANNEVIDLSQYEEIQNKVGREIDQVFVTATSLSGGGSVLFAVNNQNMGQPVFSTGQREEANLFIDQPTVLGNSYYSTALYTYGDVEIEKVTIILK